MKIPRWLRFVLFAIFVVVIVFGAIELGQGLGWLTGGNPTLYRVQFDLLRTLLGVVSVFAGMAGCIAMLAPLLAPRVRRPAELLGEPLQTERQPDGRRVLSRDLELKIDGQYVRVPQGTRTDFSTIPSFGRVLVRWSKVDVAGVVHDWLYQQGPPDWTRAAADRLWRDVAVSGDHRANAFQAWVAWAALRLFGWIAWNRHRKRDAPPASSDAPRV